MVGMVLAVCVWVGLARWSARRPSGRYRMTSRVSAVAITGWIAVWLVVELVNGAVWMMVATFACLIAACAHFALDSRPKRPKSVRWR